MDLKESLKYLKLQERTISLLIGIVVIILSVALLYKYFSPNLGKLNIKDTFQAYQFGQISPNLTSAYPADNQNLTSAPQTTNSVSVTPVVSQKPGQVALNNPANTSSTSTEAKTHTVQKGESLWKISEQYYQSGYNWVDIAQANKLKNPGNLAVGQTIFIPNVNPKVATVKNAPEKVQNAISDNSYTVQKGDCLWNIAVRAYGDGFKYSEIARENGIKTPNIILPGTSLKIPRNS